MAKEGGGGSSMLYHEVQESRLCAVHCVNAVLQGPYFSEVDLATMAQELDAQEQQVMLESGAASSHYLNYMAEGSSNVDADGNFSIQVLNRALQIWNLQCVPLEAPEAKDARADPQNQSAFICHLQAHWFCIRRVGDRWYNFNSLYPAPEYLTNFYLSAYLDTLKNSGWSIFVVQGSLPSSGHWGNDDSVGRWLSSEEAERITRAAKEAQKQKSEAKASEKESSSRIGSANLAAALAASMVSQSTASNDEDADYASAIAASLANIQCPPTATSQSQPPDASALAQALASSFFSAGVNLPGPPPPKE
jgi:ataxin-3